MPRDTSDDAPTPATPSIFLSLARLSLLRRALIAIGMAGPAIVWTLELRRAHGDGPAIVIMLAPAVLAVILANLNHAGAQIVARGIWWFNLLFGTVVMVGGAGREALPALLSCGAALALLAAWDAGLRAGEPTRVAFEPVAFRRSLLVSLTMAVAEVQLLAVGSALFEGEGGVRVGTAACAMLLALGAYGIFRLRFWGVLVHLLAMIGIATLVVMALKHAPRVDPVLVWVGTVTVQMLLPMPMLLAILRRRPVRVGPPSPIPARLFAALVVLMAGASGVAALAALR